MEFKKEKHGMKPNSFLGRAYEAKCGCKYTVTDFFVEVNELKPKDSKIKVKLEVVVYCGKDHHKDISPELIDLDLSMFVDLVQSSMYSSPEWKLDTIETMRGRAKFLGVETS